LKQTDQPPISATPPCERGGPYVFERYEELVIEIYFDLVARHTRIDASGELYPVKRVTPTMIHREMKRRFEKGLISQKPWQPRAIGNKLARFKEKMAKEVEP
jgi:hypothetical protein